MRLNMLTLKVDEEWQKWIFPKNTNTRTHTLNEKFSYHHLWKRSRVERESNLPSDSFSMHPYDEYTDCFCRPPTNTHTLTHIALKIKSFFVNAILTHLYARSTFISFIARDFYGDRCESGLRIEAPVTERMKEREKLKDFFFHETALNNQSLLVQELCSIKWKFIASAAVAVTRTKTTATAT